MNSTKFDVYKYDKYNTIDKGLFALVITKDTSESTMLLTKAELLELLSRVNNTLVIEGAI